MKNWHPKQLEILRLLGEWSSSELPRVSTVAARVGLANESGARYHLKQLDAEGLISRQMQGNGVPALLDITEAGRLVIGAPTGGAREVAAPADFGVAAIPARCGFKTLEGAGECGLLAMPHLFPRWRGDDLDHALIAENDSMQAPEGRANPESIFEGDVVHARDGIEPGHHARVYVEYKLPSGQSDCALKIMEKHGQCVILKSLNPVYGPVEVAASDIARCFIVLDVRGLQRGDTK